MPCTTYVAYIIYMYIVPILLLCPAAGAREMRRRRMRRGRLRACRCWLPAAGRARRQACPGGGPSGPGGVPESPYPGESA